MNWNEISLPLTLNETFCIKTCFSPLSSLRKKPQTRHPHPEIDSGKAELMVLVRLSAHRQASSDIMWTKAQIQSSRHTQCTVHSHVQTYINTRPFPVKTAQTTVHLFSRDYTKFPSPTNAHARAQTYRAVRDLQNWVLRIKTNLLMLRKLGRPWGREGERQRGREQHSQATPSMFFLKGRW